MTIDLKAVGDQYRAKIVVGGRTVFFGHSRSLAALEEVVRQEARRHGVRLLALP